MQPLRYSGSLTQDGREFVVRVDVAFPKEDEARQFASWIHNAIRSHIEGNGGRLKPIADKKPGPIVTPEMMMRARVRYGLTR